MNFHSEQPARNFRQILEQQPRCLSRERQMPGAKDFHLLDRPQKKYRARIILNHNRSLPMKRILSINQCEHQDAKSKQ